MSETTDAASLSGALARSVAGLRAERGWSLDHLAGRSGVSKGVLVALEQGRANPNLATLARIGDAFGVPVTRLLEGADESVVRLTGPADARVLWRGPAGGTGTIIAATPPPWAAELWQWQLEPGEEFGGDAHAPGTRELAWVQSGDLTVTVAGRRYRLGPGECARFPGDLHHRYANESAGQIAMTMVVVIPPAVG
jgi:transcriptional regulator with XRE-family HTH domain